MRYKITKTELNKRIKGKDIIIVVTSSKDGTETFEITTKEKPTMPKKIFEEPQQQYLDDRFGKIESDVAELKTGVAELKTDVAELKTDVAELKADVAELKADVAELKIDVAEIKITNNKILSTLEKLVEYHQ